MSKRDWLGPVLVAVVMTALWMLIGLKWLFILMVLAGIAAGAYIWWRGGQPEPEPNPVEHRRRYPYR